MYKTSVIVCWLAAALLQCRPAPKKEDNNLSVVDSNALLVRDTSQQSQPINVITDSFALHFAPEKLYPQQVILPVSGERFSLQLPKGFRITAAAQVQHRLRFLAKSEDGRLFATDMYDLTDNKKGRVLLFDKWNADRQLFDTVYTFLNNLHNPNQIAFYKGYLYVAETGRLARYVYKPGSTAATDSGQTIARFPDYGLGYKYGGWHLTRSLAFYNDKLYVSIGSSCNACIETETNRAVILEMNPDGSNSQVYARGLRNAVGMRFIRNSLWVTNMGRDLLGPDKPEDLFQKISKDGYYGWPYYYQYRQRVYEDENFSDSSRANYVQSPPKAVIGFKAHSAPLGFDFFNAFDHAALNNAVLVCLHGSTSVWRKRGYEVVRLEKGDTYTPFITGFLTGNNAADRKGRPCDVLQNDSRSFFVTDDLKGVLYYVWKE